MSAHRSDPGVLDAAGGDGMDEVATRVNQLDSKKLETVGEHSPTGHRAAPLRALNRLSTPHFGAISEAPWSPWRISGVRPFRSHDNFVDVDSARAAVDPARRRQALPRAGISRRGGMPAAAPAAALNRTGIARCTTSRLGSSCLPRPSATSSAMFTTVNELSMVMR